ncbi:MAG TPA: thioredoxin domain-containing protein [Candidatus Saccharimonadales bacterium]|nr:thioredoxin domain-containing protein [Candidatus Saccharimonadales bacterium]
MNKTKWIVFAAVVVLIFGGIIWANKSSEKPFTGDATKVITEGPIADHVKGGKDNKVLIIEYGDFQCPACGTMYQPMKEIVKKYGDKITFVFRNFPLTNIHPNALAAATAAEAAGLQGKFFEYHNILYENQDAWKDVTLTKREETFVNYAKMLGLDENKFKTDLKSKDVGSKIARDRSTGSNAYKVDSTPTFIIDGEKIVGTDNVDVDKITKKITDAIAKAYPEEKKNDSSNQ